MFYQYCKNYLRYTGVHFHISVPSSPVAVKADNVKATSMTISWQPPHNTSGIMIRGYQVSYTCTPLGKSECLHNVDGNTTSTELTSLEPHTEYTIFVRAKTVEFGMYSTPITVSTLDDGQLNFDQYMYLYKEPPLALLLTWFVWQ